MAPELEAVRTAIVKGMPSRVRWWLDGAPLDFDFCDAASGFRRISNSDIVGGDIEESWRSLLIFGSIEYCDGGGGSPWVALRDSDLSVCGLDVERSDSVFSFNSSVDGFIRTFILLHDYLSLGQPLPQKVREVAEAIDPGCYLNSEWRDLIDPHTIA